MTAKVHITLKNGILDPQGKTVHHALENLGIEQIEEVRMGKLIQLQLGDVPKDKAENIAKIACTKLLANPVIEDFHIELVDDEQ